MGLRMATRRPGPPVAPFKRRHVLRHTATWCWPAWACGLGFGRGMFEFGPRWLRANRLALRPGKVAMQRLPGSEEHHMLSLVYASPRCPELYTRVAMCFRVGMVAPWVAARVPR